ncbi:DUF4177 domain-containing protein [Chloroflexia bacterium SDU3-3]|nr:DUF4177 domain-containing protein [Chloroflexia bacterium SDU3-3]
MPTTRLHTAPTQRWEYQTVTLNIDGFFGPNIDELQISRTLNTAGMDGWELTSVLPVTKGQGYTAIIIAILKRPI